MPPAAGRFGSFGAATCRSSTRLIALAATISGSTRRVISTRTVAGAQMASGSHSGTFSRACHDSNRPRVGTSRSTRRIAATPSAAGLESKPSAVRRYWNRIPPRVRQRVVDAALADPERSPREVTWQLADREGHFLSESSVYRPAPSCSPPAAESPVVFRVGHGDVCMLENDGSPDVEERSRRSSST